MKKKIVILFILFSFFNLSILKAEEVSITYGSGSNYLVYTGLVNPIGSSGWTTPTTDGNFNIGNSHYFILSAPSVSSASTGASRLIDINLTNISIESGKTYRFNMIWEVGNGISLHLDNINNLKCIINNNASACSNMSMTAEQLSNSSSNNPRWLLSLYLTANVSGSSIELVINNNSTDTTGTYFFYNGADSSRGIRLNSVNAFYLTGQDALISNINNSIKETNDKLSETNAKIEDTNAKLEDINNSLNDDTEPNSDISSLGGVSGYLPEGPVDSLLNIPNYFLSTTISSLGGTCTPFTGKFVFDTDLSLLCFGDTFYQNDGTISSALMTFIDLIPSTFILIKYFKHLYKKVNRAVSLETNSDDEWGVI